MMDNRCVITIFDLALGLSQQVSHSFLARGLQLSFSSDQSDPSQWLTNILLVNPSDAPHVKSHQRKMLIFFTPSCRDSSKILNSQMKNSFSRRSPSRVRPRRKRACLLLIVLLQLPRPYLSFQHTWFGTGNPPNWGPKPKAGSWTRSFATSPSWWQCSCEYQEFQHATYLRNDTQEKNSGLAAQIRPR